MGVCFSRSSVSPPPLAILPEPSPEPPALRVAVPVSVPDTGGPSFPPTPHLDSLASFAGLLGTFSVAEDNRRLSLFPASPISASRSSAHQDAASLSILYRREFQSMDVSRSGRLTAQQVRDLVRLLHTPQAHHINSLIDYYRLGTGDSRLPRVSHRPAFIGASFSDFVFLMGKIARLSVENNEDKKNRENIRNSAQGKLKAGEGAAENFSSSELSALKEKFSAAARLGAAEAEKLLDRQRLVALVRLSYQPPTALVDSIMAYFDKDNKRWVSEAEFIEAMEKLQRFRAMKERGKALEFEKSRGINRIAAAGDDEEEPEPDPEDSQLFPSFLGAHGNSVAATPMGGQRENSWQNEEFG